VARLAPTNEEENMTEQRRRALLATSIAAAAFLATPPASAPRAAGTLSLGGTLTMVSVDALCPAGMSASTLCHSRSARGVVSGLGEVSQAYMYNGEFALCPQGDVRILGYTTSLTVAGKGEIHIVVADAPSCLTANEAALNATQSFTVTGGTGIYAGASGSGRVERVAQFASAGATGRDMWIGTLVVPGVEFDVTPPTFSGATSKTVRAPKSAKRVRVTYDVTASDAADGQVPVTCAPASGTRFPIGRSAVSCSATDTSGNTGTAKVLITVKRRR
jgi:HYR domain